MLFSHSVQTSVHNCFFQCWKTILPRPLFYQYCTNTNTHTHHLPLAADLWCCVFTWCCTALSTQHKKILENSIFVIFHSGTAAPDRWYQSFDWLRASKFLATESFSLVHTYTLHSVPFKQPRRLQRVQNSPV